jgi:hypothetical protein
MVRHVLLPPPPPSSNSPSQHSQSANTKTTSRSISNPLPTVCIPSFTLLTNLNMYVCRRYGRSESPRIAYPSRDSSRTKGCRILVLSLNQVGKAPVHKPEIVNLITSSLSEDSKSPQYEAPHGRVASSDSLRLDASEEAWPGPREHSEIRAGDSVCLSAGHDCVRARSTTH